MLALGAEIGPPFTNAPRHSMHYLATVLTDAGILELRGMTRPFGDYTLFVSQRGSLLEVDFYDPQTRSLAWVSPFGTENVVDLPTVITLVLDESSPDFDNDGLPDRAEFVLGTAIWNTDSDGDGLSDGAEVEAGTNPLDGLPAATGILASADTAGTAVDVCAINDIAIVADSDRGITVFDVTAGQAPVAVAQVDTPGTATAVACSGDLIAVADTSAGLLVIDATDPPAAGIVRQVFPIDLGGGAAQAVASAADLVLVGMDSGWLNIIDLNTGVVLDQEQVGSVVRDLDIQGEVLYAYVDNQLKTYRFLRGPIEAIGSIASPGDPFDRGHLFAGGDYAYLVKSNGFNTFDVTDPENL